MRRVALGVVAAVALIFEILGWAGLGWPGYRSALDRDDDGVACES